MFRLTRPVFQVLKTTTGITGLKVHPNPLPELVKTYQSTLTALSAIPSSSVYRQGVEALTQRKLNIVQKAGGDIAAVEKELDEGQIEESLDIAQDELNLVAKVAEWKACVIIDAFALIFVSHNMLHTVGSLWKKSQSRVNGNTRARLPQLKQHHNLTLYPLSNSHSSSAGSLMRAYGP